MSFIIPLQVWMVLLGLLTFAYWYIQYLFSFWAKRGIGSRKPHWFFGSFENWVRGKTSLAESLVDFYQEFRSEKFCGVWLFRTPTLLPIDLELIRNVLVRDFETWPSRGIPFNIESDPLSATLVQIEGKKWRTVRTKLTPGFTPQKLKTMYPLLIECGKELHKYLETVIAAGGLLDARDMSTKYLTDVNGLCALGIHMDTLNGTNPLYDKLKQYLLEPTLLRRIALMVHISFPIVFKALNLTLLSQGITDEFLDIVKQSFEYREKNKIQRNDFTDLLRSLKNTGQPLGEGEIEFDDKLLAAQAFDFFIGSFESTSGTINWCLHELAVNKDIQDRLRKEVHVTKAEGDGKITLDGVNGMKYLDMVVQETLRKYPPSLLLLRQSIKPYRIPDTDIELPTGTMCIVPGYAIQHDPEYYPNPEKFDPERFTGESKKDRPALTFLPFGAGPRNCIGIRLGECQVKVAIITILDNFEISLSEKTKNPPKFLPETKFLEAEGGTWIRISKIVHN